MNPHTSYLAQMMLIMSTCNALGAKEECWKLAVQLIGETL